MTYTTALMEVPAAMFDALKKRLQEVNYGNTIMSGQLGTPESIDMSGIVLTPARKPSLETALLPYQYRVVQVRADLNKLRVALVALIADNARWLAIDKDEQDRLIRQHRCMVELEDVLDERIASFTPAV